MYPVTLAFNHVHDVNTTLLEGCTSGTPAQLRLHTIRPARHRWHHATKRPCNVHNAAL